MLPNLVVIGAMKCATTALHRYLGGHPDVAMSQPKELNFFFGPNWDLGVEWYAGHFPGSSEAAVRGESSPGYTSPDHPEVAQRMAAVIPDAKLVYLVRDPVERALSQYRHHWADGDETRTLRAAVFDPDSQYVSRGRYYERLVPFLEHFDARRLAIVSQEQLFADRRGVLRGLFRFLEVDEGHVPGDIGGRTSVSATAPLPLSADAAAVRATLRELFRDDTDRLREVTGRAFPEWSV